MRNFCFLDNRLITDKNSPQLDLIKKMGLKCEISGFSILLGGHYYKDDDGKTYGPWWLEGKSFDEGYYFFDGKYLSEAPHMVRYIGARPALNADIVIENGINCGKNDNGVLEYKYLDYPEIIESAISSWNLEQAYKRGQVQPTGKKYTTDSADFHKEYDEYSNFYPGVYNSFGELTDYSAGFTPREHIEYEYKGNKYIRFIADENCAGKILPDGRTCYLGNPYWVRVEPITWLISEDQNIALAKNIIFAGVPYYKYPKYNLYSREEEINEFKIYDFMEGTLGCFLNLSTEDTKKQADKSLQLSDDTRKLLEQVDELIKILSPSARQIMQERRDKIIWKYQTDLEESQKIDFDSNSKPINLILNEEKNPEVTLHVSLYEITLILIEPQKMAEQIKKIDSYLELLKIKIT